MKITDYLTGRLQFCNFFQATYQTICFFTITYADAIAKILSLTYSKISASWQIKSGNRGEVIDSFSNKVSTRIKAAFSLR